MDRGKKVPAKRAIVIEPQLRAPVRAPQQKCLAAPRQAAGPAAEAATDAHAHKRPRLGEPGVPTPPQDVRPEPVVLRTPTTHHGVAAEISSRVTVFRTESHRPWW